MASLMVLLNIHHNHMPYQTRCTIYKPVPIFKTGYVRNPVIFEQTDIYCGFRDDFQQWINDNLSGYCKILEYTR